MDNFLEKIKIIMLRDRKTILLDKNLEDLYIWELADKWINKNVKSKEEFQAKVEALGNILNNAEFQKAISKSKIAFEENDIEKQNEISELIKKIVQTKEYVENSEISGYRILSKYEDINTYKTDSFIVHTNTMLKLYKYLNEKLTEVRGE